MSCKPSNILRGLCQEVASADIVLPRHEANLWRMIPGCVEEHGIPNGQNWEKVRKAFYSADADIPNDNTGLWTADDSMQLNVDYEQSWRSRSFVATFMDLVARASARQIRKEKRAAAIAHYAAMGYYGDPPSPPSPSCACLACLSFNSCPITFEITPPDDGDPPGWTNGRPLSLEELRATTPSVVAPLRKRNRGPPTPTPLRATAPEFSPAKMIRSAAAHNGGPPEATTSTAPKTPLVPSILITSYCDGSYQDWKGGSFCGVERRNDGIDSAGLSKIAEDSEEQPSHDSNLEMDSWLKAMLARPNRAD